MRRPSTGSAPIPTASSLESDGPFASTSSVVADSATPDFGAATIHSPTDTSLPTLGGIAISPGCTETQSDVAWFGPRLSSHGFIVIIFGALSPYDSPAARGEQLLAALDYLTGSSDVKDRVDATRLPVMGHSMGGGGSLEAIKTRPALQAALPMTPWHDDKTWPEPTSPTLISKYSISWLKRFVDNDTRYEQSLCPPPAPDRVIEEYRDTCPHS